MSRWTTWTSVAVWGLAALSTSSVFAADVSIQAKDSRADVSINGQPFTSVRNDLGPKPILYPIIGPTGKRMTRDYPMADVAGEMKDHPHHRSLWFTHGNVNGVDFWSENKDHGHIEHVGFTKVTVGDVSTIVEKTRWVTPDKTALLEDVRTYGFSEADGARIIDFDVTVKALDKPVIFGDTKEGSFGVRVPTTLDVDRKKGDTRPSGKIVNDAGQTDAAAWGQRAAWVDYSGPVDGEQVGITIMNHPTSFRYPTTWHVRTYGLFAANPFGLKEFQPKEGQDGSLTLAPGESFTLRYRVLLHKGDATEGKVAEAFKAYAEVKKPQVEQPK